MNKLLLVKLEEIDDYLTNNYECISSIGGLTGLSGIATFHFHYARLLNNEKIENHAYKLIKLCVDKIDNGFDSFNYTEGISGFGWILDRLEQDNFLNSPNDSLLAPLNELIYSNMLLNNKIGNLDFLAGTIGHSMFFLKRYECTKDSVLKNRYKEYLLTIIDHIGKLRRNNNNNLLWETIINRKTLERGCNLGLSHGISGILIFLSKLYGFSDFRNRVEPMIIEGVNYLISKKGKSSDFSFFPNYINESGGQDEKSRLGWCYGDLGIALAIWYCGKALSDTKIKDVAMEILLIAGKRKDVTETFIVDSGLCHGAFGVAQIYNRMSVETNTTKFKEYAEFWIAEGLKMVKSNVTTHAGFLQFQGQDSKWKGKQNLLEGIAGIGLTIISQLTNLESNWDECLLIS